MKYLVGYIGAEPGREALALGAMLARAENVELERCTVMPAPVPPSGTPSEPGVTELLRDKLEELPTEALAGIGAEVPVFLGPTSSRMLRHSPVPVLVVPCQAEVSLEHPAEHGVDEAATKTPTDEVIRCPSSANWATT